jgi:predicted XRE-type DNA-binding protein
VKQIAKIAEIAKIGNLQETLRQRRKIMKRVSAKSGKTSIIPNSGNVFSGLQLPDADEKQTKIRLAVTINQIIASANLSQAAASEVLKVNQPKISALANYRLDGVRGPKYSHSAGAYRAFCQNQAIAPTLCRDAVDIDRPPPMRIAVIFDIHGNLTALDAVVADLRPQKPDLVLHGGDLPYGGSHPAEVIELHRAGRLEGRSGQYRRNAVGQLCPAGAGSLSPQPEASVQGALRAVRPGNPTDDRRIANGMAARTANGAAA